MELATLRVRPKFPTRWKSPRVRDGILVLVRRSCLNPGGSGEGRRYSIQFSSGRPTFQYRNSLWGQAVRAALAFVGQIPYIISGDVSHRKFPTALGVGQLVVRLELADPHAARLHRQLASCLCIRHTFNRRVIVRPYRRTHAFTNFLFTADRVISVMRAKRFAPIEFWHPDAFDSISSVYVFKWSHRWIKKMWKSTFAGWSGWRQMCLLQNWRQRALSLGLSPVLLGPPCNGSELIAVLKIRRSTFFFVPEASMRWQCWQGAPSMACLNANRVIKRCATSSWRILLSRP